MCGRHLDFTTLSYKVTQSVPSWNQRSPWGWPRRSFCTCRGNADVTFPAPVSGTASGDLLLAGSSFLGWWQPSLGNPTAESSKVQGSGSHHSTRTWHIQVSANGVPMRHSALTWKPDKRINDFSPHCNYGFIKKKEQMCNIFTRDDFFSLSLVFKENEEVISRDRKKKKLKWGTVF